MPQLLQVITETGSTNAKLTFTTDVESVSEFIFSADKSWGLNDPVRIHTFDVRTLNNSPLFPNNTYSYTVRFKFLDGSVVSYNGSFITDETAQVQTINTAPGEVPPGSDIFPTYDTFSLLPDPSVSPEAIVLVLNLEGEEPNRRFPGLYRSNGSSWNYLGQGELNYSIILNNRVIEHDIVLPSGKNGISAGPITIPTGVTVEIPPGSSWVVV